MNKYRVSITRNGENTQMEYVYRHCAFLAFERMVMQKNAIVEMFEMKPGSDWRSISRYAPAVRP